MDWDGGWCRIWGLYFPREEQSRFLVSMDNIYRGGTSKYLIIDDAMANPFRSKKDGHGFMKDFPPFA
jgi:hypothetical protein